jgi:sorbitol-specific phosphotransferase system component IIC
MSVVLFASMLICIFGAVYSHSSGMLSFGDRCPTGFTPYYFSIVTYTTLGFGDVKPNNLPGEILVSTEVIMGYVTLGLLLAVLADKIARRS